MRARYASLRFGRNNKLNGNLRKAPKLTYRALHPGNNKQNVGLALGIFHETTIAACMSYFPDRTDASVFLTLISTWWCIANSNKRYDSNSLANAIEENDGKLDFYEEFAAWIEKWSNFSKFSLSKQTSNALTLTLRSQAMLSRDLLSEGYSYILTRRFQSDPLEHRFSRYRSMSGGRFLVSLREVVSTERILTCRSLLKAGVDYWRNMKTHDGFTEEDSLKLMEKLEEHEQEIFEGTLSENSLEVAQCVAGYMARKLLKKPCNDCYPRLIDETSSDKECNYLNILSRGGLITPSKNLASMVSSSFAQVEYINQFLDNSNVRKSAKIALEKYAPDEDVACEVHQQYNRLKAINIVINCFYNNMQKLDNDAVRKESIVDFKQRQRRND